jgi:nitrous oxidase accessory protein NosD
MVPLVLLSIAAVGAILLILALSGAEGDASSSPPPVGDWNIDVGEDVSQSHTTFDLHGDLHVYGRLSLNGTTLWVWSTPSATRVLTVHPGGTLVLDDDQLSAGDPAAPYIFRAEAGSSLEVAHTSFYRAGLTTTTGGRDAGMYLATPTDIHQSQFYNCRVGVFVDGVAVTLDGCAFLDCSLGVAVKGGGQLDIDQGEFISCNVAALTEASPLTILGANFQGCTDGVVSDAGELEMRGCRLWGFGLQGVGAYGGSALIQGCAFWDGASDGILSNSARLRAFDNTFSNLTADIRAINGEVWIGNSTHALARDAALMMQRTTFHADGESVRDCYWALRADLSTGDCRNLTTVNCTLAVQLTYCDGVVLEGLDVNGSYRPSIHGDPRGIVSSGSTITVLDSTIHSVRNAISLEATHGLVEGVTARDCAREGVTVRECTGLVLRNVIVTNATDGFLLSLYSHSRLEGCHADSCLAGFNFTAGTRDTLVGCNASACGIGADVYMSSPRLLGCTLYQYDALGRNLNFTYGLFSLDASPELVGGRIMGGMAGAKLNGSHARLIDVTFNGTEFYCVELENSPGDLIEGCDLLGGRMAAGVVMTYSSPVIRGCIARGMAYGINLYCESAAMIEGNRIEDIGYDGVSVISSSIAMLSGNVFSRCGSEGLWILLDSVVTSRGDTFNGSTDPNVAVWWGSSLDMEGATISGSSIGVLAVDAPHVRVAYSELMDLNRGIYVSRGGSGMAPYIECIVEGCYFHNHSASCVVVRDAYLRVSGCSFLDNIAAIEVYNTTVEIVETSLVASWLFGIKADSSPVSWTVGELSRILDSDVTGEVDFVARGGRLEIVDSVLTLFPGSSIDVGPGTVLVVRGSKVSGGAGVTFTVDRSPVELTEVVLDGFGPTTGGSPGTLGVSMTGCDLVAYNATFRRARGGLSLTGSTAVLEKCLIRECSEHGLYAEGSTVTMTGCTVERVVLGTGILLVDTDLVANGTASGNCVRSIRAVRGTARLTNCTLLGSEIAPLDVEGATVTLVNTTHELGKVLVTSAGVVETWWYVSVGVVWANMSELPEAEVSVHDAAGSWVAGGHPDLEGRLPFLLVLATRQTPGGLVALGPHVVSARLHGYVVDRSVLLESSVDVELRLIDESPPVLDILSPAASETWTARGTVEVFGRANDTGSGTARVEARLDYSGTLYMSEGEVFAFTFRLTNGQHIIVLRAVDRAGNAANATLMLHVETTPLALAVNLPFDGTATNATRVTVEGLVSRAGAQVRVNHAPAEVDGNAWSYVLELAEGRNPIGVEATDVYGHRAFANLSVWVDRTAPTLTVTSERLVNTTGEWAPIEGAVGPGANVTIGGIPVVLKDGRFAVRYSVNMGQTLVVVRAVDAVGNQVVVNVLVERTAPEVPPTGPNWWEAVPFVIALPLLMVAVWYVLTRPAEGGGER